MSTASREPFDERAPTALLSNSLRRLRPTTPFTSPDVKHTNRRPQVTIRFFLDSLPGRRLARRHVREGNDRNGLRFDPSQSTRCVQTSDSTSSRCHGPSPVSRRCIGAALSAAHSQQNEHAKPASTFNMGRRIMAKRRRHRRERRRQHRPYVRTNANNPIDAQCDEHLRVFVRALARQAARELFEAQRARHSAEIH